MLFNQEGGPLEDNLYIITFAPDEFHEALTEYENHVEWCEESMLSEQMELAKRVLARLYEADALHVCLDEVDQPAQGKQEKLFTRDDVARIIASTLSTVFEKVHLEQIALGVAVLPAGKGVYLIDVVMRELANDSTWGVSIIIPPIEETIDGRT